MRSGIYDAVIVGGGIVGLALGRELLRRRPVTRLAVLEKEAEIASHQTGHNSGVIHTGVYYKPGSLKARLCVAGAREMLAYCREQGIPHRVAGKVIVATSAAELPGLHEVHRRGGENGVEGLRWLDLGGLRAIEPHIQGVAALHVPTAAITDYLAVAQAYARAIQAHGGEVLRGVEVVGFRQYAAAIAVETSRGTFEARQVINCAGLFADRIAALAGSPVPEGRVLPFRGEYFALRAGGGGLTRGLVYPVPDPRFPFLGVHFTPRIHGGVEAGPNAVLAWKREGYGRLDWNARDISATLGYRGFWAMAARYWRNGLAEQYRSLSRPAFIRALRRLLPDLRDADVAPGGSGVRAQIVLRNGKLMDDFFVRREGSYLHVLNVPSPAATSSLAISRYLVDQYF